MSQPTKFYSSRQEHMVAEYLGWSVVSGSGARAFNPGDIRSDNFLGECKTFTKESDTIYCYNNVWSKITEEATAVMKKPVLFVDNGTQEAKNTWCIIPQHFIDAVPNVSQLERKLADSLLKVSKTRVSFSHTEVSYQFMMYKRIVNTDLIALPFTLAGVNVSLISLKSLKTIIEGDD